MINKTWILLSLLYIGTWNAAQFKLIKLDDPQAVCLDGSPGAYYYNQGDPKKFLLYFEGGGWCGAPSLSSTLDSCYGRSSSPLGSSNSYPAEISFKDGILSDNVLNYFKDWTKVSLKYCDGAGHQGTRSNPISYKGKNLYFRGNNLTIAKFDSLEKLYKMFSQSTHIVVSGCSAGGLAAYLWTNYVAEHVNQNAKVWSAPDSGMFLDEYNFRSMTPNYRMSFAFLLQLSNQQISPPVPQCVARYPSTPEKCMFAENIYQQIKVPLFPIESLYDSWSLPQILGITCPQHASFQNCNQSDKKIIEEYHLNTTKVLQQIAINKINGMWAPACSDHCYSPGTALYSSAFRIPMNSNMSLTASLQQWIQGTSQNNQHIDLDSWPSNTPCSGQTSVKVHILNS